VRSSRALLVSRLGIPSGGTNAGAKGPSTGHQGTRRRGELEKAGTITWKAKGVIRFGDNANENHHHGDRAGHRSLPRRVQGEFNGNKVMILTVITATRVGGRSATW